MRRFKSQTWCLPTTSCCWEAWAQWQQAAMTCCRGMMAWTSKRWCSASSLGITALLWVRTHSGTKATWAHSSATSCTKWTRSNSQARELLSRSLRLMTPSLWRTSCLTCSTKTRQSTLATWTLSRCIRLCSSSIICRRRKSMSRGSNRWLTLLWRIWRLNNRRIKLNFQRFSSCSKTINNNRRKNLKTQWITVLFRQHLILYRRRASLQRTRKAPQVKSILGSPPLETCWAQ